MADMTGATSASKRGGHLRVGLIDSFRLSQECLVKAFKGLHPRLVIVPATTAESLIRTERADLDLVIYYAHAADDVETTTLQSIAAIRQAFERVPLIVLSDSEDAQQAKTICGTLKCGAHGFIPTRTTGIPIALAAIRFVKEGGTFAPVDALLTNRPDWAPPPKLGWRNRLTPRQRIVLSHLQQGKANKIIAYELSMSESTVKVHVRNIMRKMGATNRTQAVYKAQKLWSGLEALQGSEY